MEFWVYEAPLDSQGRPVRFAHRFVTLLWPALTKNQMNPELRFRQIHLDFHTSEHIPGVGSAFDPEAFVSTLKAASVNSVTCFSRCHHGWIYHPSKFPYVHPNLTEPDLLGAQIRACHAADIKVPIYITVGWDHLMAQLHPEWVEVNEHGKFVGREPLSDGGGWRNMDFASPYVDFLVEQTQEVCDRYGDEVDGFFFDIIFQTGVHSQSCLERFRQLGWDPKDQAKQAELRQLLVTEVTDRLFGAVREKNKHCSVFFNGGHVGPAFRRMLGNYSHLEIESLPTGGWGYMHFPITVRYARTLGKPYLAMTGKFSETWGHFGSYKNVAALEYECFQALAQGAQCSVGDQLHPLGKLDAATYDLIGKVYRQIEDVEPWCKGAKSVTEIAVLNAEQFDKSSERMDPRNLGAARILIEGRHQFDFVDTESDWTAYKVLILPDVVPASPEIIAKLSAFTDQGGALISSYRSALPATGNVSGPLASVIDSVKGDLDFSPTFLRPNEELSSQSSTDFVMYERGLKVTPVRDATVLAQEAAPYFNRTWDHFCSHAHAPADQLTDNPLVLRAENMIYFSHPVFTTYARHSMSFHRDLVLAAIATLLPEPLVKLDGPTSLQATLTEQPDRTLLHLLHYIPERRGLNFDVVEDPMPVNESEVWVRTERTRAIKVPSGEVLPAQRVGGYLVITVPAFLGRTIVSIED